MQGNTDQPRPYTVHGETPRYATRPHVGRHLGLGDQPHLPCEVDGPIQVLELADALTVQSADPRCFEAIAAAATECARRLRVLNGQADPVPAEVPQTLGAILAAAHGVKAVPATDLDPGVTRDAVTLIGRIDPPLGGLLTAVLSGHSDLTPAQALDRLFGDGPHHNAQIAVDTVEDALRRLDGWLSA